MRRDRLAKVAIGAATLSVVVGVAGAQAPSAPPAAVDGPNVCLPGSGSRSWCGDDGPATQAMLAGPSDVAVARDGSLLIADTLNNVVRRVRRDGTIVSIAGTGTEAPAPRRDRAKETGFSAPAGVAATTDGDVLVADTGNHAIRVISTTGTVTTRVGQRGRIEADLAEPSDVVPLPDGAMLISDTGHHRVIRVAVDGTIVVLAGSGRPGYAGDVGPATEAQLRRPTQVAPTADGGLLIADSGNGAVRRVLPSGMIDTLTSGLTDPRGVLPLGDGSAIVAGAKGLHRVDPTGARQRIAGGPTRGFTGDEGDATSLQFDGIGQLAAGSDGPVLFAEGGSDRVRALDPGGRVTTVAGSGIPRPAPTLGIPAGPVPAELRAAVAQPPRARRAHRRTGRSAAATNCEGYDPRYAIFTLVPQTRTTLRVRGPRRLRLRYRMSRNAKVKVEIYKGERRIDSELTSRVKVRQRGNRIQVAGRFRRGTRYVAKLWGRSLRGSVLRCDVKRMRVR
jgi:streptogramin lyase